LINLKSKKYDKAADRRSAAFSLLYSSLSFL